MNYLKLVFLFFSLSLFNCKTETKPKLTVNVVLSDSLSAKQLDGRLLLILSDNNESEPRFQVGEGLNAQPIFGMNVENWSGEKEFSFDSLASKSLASFSACIFANDVASSHIICPKLAARRRFCTYQKLLFAFDANFALVFSRSCRSNC